MKQALFDSTKKLLDFLNKYDTACHEFFSVMMAITKVAIRNKFCDKSRRKRKCNYYYRTYVVNRGNETIYIPQMQCQ